MTGDAADDRKEAFHRLVAGIDYPMFIVTVASAEDRDGCLVGFLTQASIRPPRLMVMLSKANRTYRVAQGASQLVVHFLHAGNRGLSELFGEQTGDSIDKFSRCQWQAVTGIDVPVLRGTRGWVAGSILDRVDCGDHVGHLIDVVGARIDEPGPQLAFQAVKDMKPGHPA